MSNQNNPEQPGTGRPGGSPPNRPIDPPGPPTDRPPRDRDDRPRRPDRKHA